jgi:transcriptional regulator with XRE-family HTH domain
MLKANEPYFIHELNSNTIADAVHEVRLRRGISMKELSELTGISESTICKIENNTQDPRITTVVRIFETLNTKIFFNIELQRFWKEFNAEQKRNLKNKKK